MSESERRQHVTRRAMLCGVAAAAGVVLVGPTCAAGDAVADSGLFCAPLVPFRVSLSVSPFTEAVLRQTRLTDGSFTAGSVAATQQLYMRHGATEVYVRIATRKVAPQGRVAEHGWARGLERARLARQLDLPLNPELGLWAQYGDGGNYQQPPDFHDYPEINLPGPWLSLSLEQMLPAIRRYGSLIAQKILATGVRVEMWDIGNEVEAGIAGVTVRPMRDAYGPPYRPPDGVDPAIGRMSAAQLMKMRERDQIDWCTRHLWPYTGRILAAAAAGIREVDPKARFSTHIAPVGATTSAWSVAFYSTCKAAGFLPDIFGFSFYPGAFRKLEDAADAFSWLKATSAALMSRYGRPSFIAEGGVASGIAPGGSLFSEPLEHYALTESGQYSFNHDLIAWGAQSGHLAGYRPWAPDFCTVAGWAPMSWFDRHGRMARAKPVLSAYEKALPSLYAQVERGPAGLEVGLRTTGARLHGVAVELRDAGGTLARAAVAEVGPTWTHAVLDGGRKGGSEPHTVLVSRGGAVLMERRV